MAQIYNMYQSLQGELAREITVFTVTYNHVYRSAICRENTVLYRASTVCVLCMKRALEILNKLCVLIVAVGYVRVKESSNIFQAIRSLIYFVFMYRYLLILCAFLTVHLLYMYMYSMFFLCHCYLTQSYMYMLCIVFSQTRALCKRQYDNLIVILFICVC